jgi:hypothetical protein
VVELLLDDDEASLKAESAIERPRARLTELASVIDMDHSVRGLTASTQAGIDISACRLSGFLFVVGDRDKYRQYTERLCSTLDYRNEIARLVSVADLGIAEMSVEKAVWPETNEVIRLLHRFGNTTVPFHMDQESGGTMAYLALLGPAVDAIKKGSPLLIDEFDAGLHSLLAIQLLRLFSTPASNPKGAQLIFNTHSANLLASGVLRRDQIWFTEKGNDATSHLYPLSDFKPRRQENFENGYLQGRYGAIPFIDPDTFLHRFEADTVKA